MESDEIPNDANIRIFLNRLAKTVSLGENLKNTICELKIFIDELTVLFSKWNLVTNQVVCKSKWIGKHHRLVFKEIEEIVYDYFRFRREYLLKRELEFTPGLTPTEKLFILFDKSVRACGINEFLNNETDYPFEVCCFVKIIRSYGLTYKDEDERYMKIVEFTDTIDNYYNITVILRDNIFYDSYDVLLTHENKDVTLKAFDAWRPFNFIAYKDQSSSKSIECDNQHLMHFESSVDDLNKKLLSLYKEIYEDNT